MRRFKSYAGQERAAYLSSLLVLVFHALAGLFRRTKAHAARMRPLEQSRPSQAGAL